MVKHIVIFKKMELLICLIQRVILWTHTDGMEILLKSYHQISFTDSNCTTATMPYNAANLPISRSDNAGVGVAAKTESYTYFADCKIATKKDRNGVTIAYGYDIHGRRLCQTAGISTVSYTYDANGNQLTTTDTTGSKLINIMNKWKLK